ncbi:hypothetical protein [Pyrobaculum neutrophilum]|uniref:Family 577 protein n=1 Tax=Pyrobaculum neutrophilum (strain DSM 2338 / JCM 9278 / NBRC 100436 / V24Sta) TaxID=444157 RepID=B1Y9H7_PYRNV|nr:hypothetical protein [Pyrobaculum neutrophilum]ACB40406.1 family 577 protein [Pyrobaculum neutrophilum V24Sta]
MRFFEEINAARRYRTFVEAVGGVGQLKKTLMWSDWYAVKWWEEIFKELGLSSIRESVFARALYISLKIRGYVGEDGRVRKKVERPGYPTNSYALEFVELHESLDRVGAVNLALNKAGEVVKILASAVPTSGWCRAIRRTFLDVVDVRRFDTIYEPVAKDGAVALSVFELHRPKLYIASDYKRENVELAATVLKAKPEECVRGICIFSAPNICDAAKAVRRYAPEGVSAVLMLFTLNWLVDPVMELSCVASALASGGRLLVGQQVVETMPGFVAMMAALGAKHVLSWRGVEQTLKAAGFRLERRYLRYFPIYVAVWKIGG